MREPVNIGTPLVLLLISLCIIAAMWSYLATPVSFASAPIDSATKLDCVSYAPFRGDQTPFAAGIVISSEQIAADLVDLAKISKCVRTYSVENGLDKVPELASKVGLTVILGVWIGRDRLKNERLIETAIALTKDYPGVITAIIVGSEVLLRGEMTTSDLRQTIRSVRALVSIPVSYADVWEFWQRYREISNDVDFVTIHILPYWEDFPVRAKDAAAHVDDIRKRMALVFPGKEILIGETGWPSRGRMRDGALPSPINQASFISEILDRARQEHYRVSLFEAYDEPWKRQWEGTVGGHWGLFDGEDRQLKYPAGGSVSNRPFWPLQLGSGLVLSVCTFGAAFLAVRRRRSAPRLASWMAVATSATICGVLLGVSAEEMLYDSYGLDDWLVRGGLLLTGIVAPLVSSAALMSKRTLPTFVELIGPRESRIPSVPIMILGLTLILTSLIAADTALALVFDPRWRDFPFAGLTMSVVPFGTLALLNRSRSAIAPPVAEAVFAGLFAAAGFYILCNEGVQNWQSVWTSVSYLLFGALLWQARFVAGTEAAKSNIFTKMA